MIRAFPSLLLRDIIFRFISFSFFIKLLNVEHKPSFKYKFSEIKQYIQLKHKQGENVDPSVFMDYSQFKIKSSFNMIFLNLVFCTAFATLITHPLDVISTKILTQTRLKYKGLIQSYNLIIKEEGIKKLYLSGLSFRYSFNIISSMSVLLFFEKFVIYFNDSIN